MHAEKPEVVEVLLALGADPTAVDETGPRSPPPPPAHAASSCPPWPRLGGRLCCASVSDTVRDVWLSAGTGEKPLEIARRLRNFDMLKSLQASEDQEAAAGSKAPAAAGTGKGAGAGFGEGLGGLGFGSRAGLLGGERRSGGAPPGTQPQHTGPGVLYELVC